MSNTRALRLPPAACCSLLLAAAVPLHARAAAPADAAALYVDATTYLHGDARLDAWFTMLAGLRRGFDDICGDTFCEGEYSNIESLRYRCSVHQASGRIGACVWLFAASNEEIDPATGEIVAQPKFWRCRTPLAPDTTVEDLLSAIAGPSPLHAPLPGSDRSIYDGLVDCL